MIVTKIKDLSLYKDIIPNYKEIQNIDFHKYKSGVHKIQDNNFFVIVEKNLTSNAIYESHKKFIDIHIPLSKSECIKFISDNDYKIIKEYSDSEDASLGYSSEKESILKIKPGEAVIFLPGEPHMPLLEYQDSGKIKKAIVKVLWKK